MYETQTTQVKPNNSNNYYKNMFAQQSDMVGKMLQNDIFTNVEDYSSNDGYDDYSTAAGDVAYIEGNAPWGNDPDTYTINIYNNSSSFGYGFRGGFGYGYGFGYPYYGSFYDPFYDPFFDPYFSPFATRGWVIGFNNPWIYRGFGYSPYGFGNPWYNHGRYGYGYPYRGGAYNVAYNRGRRTTANYRSSTRSDRSDYARSIRNIRNAQADGVRSRSRTRTSNDGYNRDNVYSRTSRRTETSGYYDRSNSRTSSPAYRSSRTNTSRASESSYPSRRSSSTTRSVRSSNSTSRSSGTTTRSSSSGSSRTSRGGRGGI